jgi:hypothetical protein
MHYRIPSDAFHLLFIPHFDERRIEKLQGEAQ